MSRKRNNTLLLATIATGAYAYFSKKENREKAQAAFHNMKTKEESFIDERKKDPAKIEEQDEVESYSISESEMVSEGAQTTVNYYNQEMQDPSEEDQEGLYRKEKMDTV